MHMSKFINCILLNLQLVVCPSYINKAEREREAAGQNNHDPGKNNEKKNNAEKPGARARQKPEVR